MNPRSFAAAVTRQVLLLVGIVAGARAQGAQSTPSASCPGTWSTPFRVQRADGRPVFVEPGPIAPLGRATVAIGAPTFFWLGKDHLAVEQDMATDSAQVRWAMTRSGALIDSTGTATPLASIGSGQEWKHPGLLAWSNRRLDVAWSAGDSAQSTGMPNDATQIAVASFDGRRWTAPRTILRAWHVRFIDPPAMRAGMPFDVGVVAATVRDSAGYAVRVARRLVGNWATADWRGATFVHSASAVTTADGSVVVVMVATPKQGSAGVYSMRADRWPTSDSDWAPQRIDSLRSGVGFGAFAWARLGADSLVVVWSQSGGDASSLGLTTALSVDGAKSWRLMPPLIPASPIDDQRLAVDAQGRLHVVSSTTKNDSGMDGPIVHAIWQSGTWTTPTAVSTQASETAPGLGFAPGGRLMATWTEDVETSQGPLPRTLASLWTPNCTTRR